MCTLSSVYTVHVMYVSINVYNIGCVHMYICFVHACMYVHVCMYICFVCECVYVCVDVCVCLCVHIH